MRELLNRLLEEDIFKPHGEEVRKKLEQDFGILDNEEQLSYLQNALDDLELKELIAFATKYSGVSKEYIFKNVENKNNLIRVIMNAAYAKPSTRKELYLKALSK